MSFGWSAGDIISGINLALKTYNSYHSSCAEFHDLRQTIDTFQYVLGEGSKALTERVLNEEQKKGLETLLEQALELSKELNSFVTKNKNPHTGKLPTSRRLIWQSQSSHVDRLRGRIQTLTTFFTFITSVNSHEDNRAILETVKNLQSELGPRRVSDVAEAHTSSTVSYDTGWEQVLKTPEADITHKEWETTMLEVKEEDKAYDVHDHTSFDRKLSPSATFASQSPTLVTRVPTGSSGASTSSGGRKPSFMDARPKPGSLTFNPVRVKRADSASSASIETKDKESKRRASTTVLLKLKPRLVPPGSSAPSIAQQRLPFSPGFASPYSPPRAISNTESTASPRMRLSRSHTGVFST